MPSDINNCILTPEFYQTNVPDQIPQLIVENIGYVALNDPFSNTVAGGTFAMNQGESIRTIVPTQPILNQSYTQPNFGPWLNHACGTIGTAANAGEVLYTTAPQFLRGNSGTICLTEVYGKVKNTISNWISIMRKGLFELNRNDTRYNLYAIAGNSFVARSSGSFESMFNGDFFAPSVGFDWSHGLPSAPMSFQALLQIMTYIRTNVRNVEYWPGPGDGMFKANVSAEQLEIFRNDPRLNADVTSAIRGSYDDAKKAEWQYFFEDYPYRGVSFGVDQQPMRFNTIDASGNPILIEPLIPAAASYGYQMVVNPAWQTALYEIMLLETKDTIRKLIPEQYMGEGGMVFPPQYYTGQLNWVNNKDMGCNPLGELGMFIWTYVRAWQPIRPAGLVKIAYQRCQSDLGLSTCPNVAS